MVTITLTDSQKKLYAKVGAAVFALLFVVCFYFLYWVRRPAYSLSLIGRALHNHDIDTFERYVDLDSVLPKAYEDMMVAYSKTSGENLSNPLAAAAVQAAKAEQVTDMRAAVISRVKGESSSLEDKLTLAQSGKQTDGAADHSFNSTIFDSSYVIAKEGNMATVGVKMMHTGLNREITVKVRMGKMENGKWRVKEIMNLYDLIVEIDRYQKEQDAQKKKEIYKNVQVNVSYFAEAGCVAAEWKMKNVSTKEIKNLTAYIIAFDAKSGEVYKKSELLTAKNIKPGEIKDGEPAVLEFDVEDYGQREIYSRLYGDTEIDVKVMSLEFDDGTKIEREEIR